MSVWFSRLGGPEGVESHFRVEEFRSEITRSHWDVRLFRYKGGSSELRTMFGTSVDNHALILIQGRSGYFSNTPFQTIIDLVTDQRGEQFRLPYGECYKPVPTITMNRCEQDKVKYFKTSEPFSVPSQRIIDLFSSGVYDKSPAERARIKLVDCVAVPANIKCSLFGQANYGNEIYTYLYGRKEHNCLTLANRLLRALDIPAFYDDLFSTTDSAIDNLNWKARDYGGVSLAPNIARIYQSISDNNIPYLKCHIDFIRRSIHELHGPIVKRTTLPGVDIGTYLSMSVIKGHLEAVRFLVMVCHADIAQRFGQYRNWTALDCVYLNGSSGYPQPELKQDQRRINIERFLKDELAKQDAPCCGCIVQYIA